MKLISRHRPFGRINLRLAQTVSHVITHLTQVGYNSDMLRNLTVVMLLLMFLAASAGRSIGEEVTAGFTAAVHLLRSPYWSDRNAGAEMLKGLHASDVPELIKLLDDPDDRVAALVAIELAGRSERTCVPRLYELLRSQTPRYYSVILPLLHQFGSTGYDEFLFTLLQDSNPDISKACASAIAKFALDEELSTHIFIELGNMLRSGSFEQRICTERVFSLIGKNAVPYLLNALGARFPTSFSAMNSLVGIGAPSVQPLIDIVRTGTDGSLSLRAAMTLAQIRDDAAQDAISWLIINSTDSLVRTAAGYALRGYNGDSALLFEILLKDVDSRVRAAALHSLVYVENWPENLLQAFIVARLGDVSAEVRNYAVLAAGRHKLQDAVRLLPELFHDPSKSVMTNALWTAGNYGNTDIISDLLPFLGESDPILRLAAAKSLLQLGSSEGEAIIIDALRKDDEYRENALFALSFAHNKMVVDEIVAILPRLKPRMTELARYVLYSVTGMILEVNEWPSWWAVFRSFWEYEQREGYTAFSRGRMFQDSAMAHVATEYFTAAAVNAPTFPEAHYENAKLLQSTGDNVSLELALVEIRKAIALLPQPRYYVVHAKVLFDMKRYDEALQVVRAGLAAGNSADIDLKILEKKILDRISR